MNFQIIRIFSLNSLQRSVLFDEVGCCGNPTKIHSSLDRPMNLSSRTICSLNKISTRVRDVVGASHMATMVAVGLLFLTAVCHPTQAEFILHSSDHGYDTFVANQSRGASASTTAGATTSEDHQDDSTEPKLLPPDDHFSEVAYTGNGGCSGSSNSSSSVERDNAGATVFHDNFALLSELHERLTARDLLAPPEPDPLEMLDPPK